MSRRICQYMVLVLSLFTVMNLLASANSPHNATSGDVAPAVFSDVSHGNHALLTGCEAVHFSACTPADAQGACLDNCGSYCSSCPSPVVSIFFLFTYQRFALSASGPDTSPLAGHIAKVQRPPIPVF